MNRTAEAVLASGRRIPYVITDSPPRGGMKYTYFAPYKSYVLQFFNDPIIIDPNTLSRIEAIIGRYNPTLPESRGGAIGNDEKIASYFANRFCWPTDIVVYPEFGLVSRHIRATFLTSDASTCSWKG